MTNGTTDYLDLFDPNGMTVGGAGGVLTVDEVSGGDAIGGVNNQQNAFQFGFQFGVDPSTSSRVFTAKTRILAPFAGMTPEAYQSMGLFIGTGNQDNYIKPVTSARDGTGGIEFAKEVGGEFTNRPQPAVPMPGPDYVDLYLTVDPDAGTVQPSYVVSTNGQAGPRTQLGGPEPVPASWLDGTNALALGVISTSIGSSNTFPASWDFIEVVYGDGSPSAEPSEVAANPESLGFGSVKVGESASKQVVLTNAGSQKAAEVSNVGISGPDASAFGHGFTTPVTVEPGESTTLDVSFSPLGEGLKNATLDIEHDGSSSPLSIPLSGQGAVPGGVLYRVNAGGPAIADPAWSVDSPENPSPYVNASQTGNAASVTDNAIDTSHPSVPAGTPASVFQTERWDPPDAPGMSWAFPVEPGSYEVRLHFAETDGVINSPGGCSTCSQRGTPSSTTTTCSPRAAVSTKESSRPSRFRATTS